MDSEYNMPFKGGGGMLVLLTAIHPCVNFVTKTRKKSLINDHE